MVICWNYYLVPHRWSYENQSERNLQFRKVYPNWGTLHVIGNWFTMLSSYQSTIVLNKKTKKGLSIPVRSTKRTVVASCYQETSLWPASASLAVQLGKVHLVCLLDDLPLELEGSRDEAWLRRPWLWYQLNFGWDLKFLQSCLLSSLKNKHVSVKIK